MPSQKPYIKSINQLGELKVGFIHPLVIPDFASFPELLANPNLCPNCTTTSQGRDLQAGQDAVEIINKGQFLNYEGEYERILDIVVVSGNSEDLRSQQFQWECKSFEKQEIQFKLDFEHAGAVSIFDIQDKLDIKFNDQRYFRSVNNYYVPKRLKISAGLPG